MDEVEATSSSSHCVHVGLVVERCSLPAFQRFVPFFVHFSFTSQGTVLNSE